MTVQETTGVREVIDGIAKAWANNDPDAFADLYTTNASMILSGDRYLSGREVIREVVTQQFKSAHAGTTLLQNIVDVRSIADDVAVAITEGGVLAPGEDVPSDERSIRATWVLRKGGDSWLIAAYQNTRTSEAALPGL
ncbi:SgcJ/EcaC family oxidoreductase [Saccharothrix sp. NEAU-S10]|nr:SgcJ/EcaC family oxidoreductase [Saccharothrix luteola]